MVVAERKTTPYPADAVRFVPAHFLPAFDFEGLLDRAVQFVALHGGRSGGKSRTIGLLVILFIMYLERTEGRPVRFLCLRETLQSIGDSVKAVLEDAIDILGYGDYFQVTERFIRTPLGGRIIFRGMNESYRTLTQVKSIEGVRGVWFEEATEQSARTRELLYPTIFRNHRSLTFISFNPLNRSDPVYRDFVAPGLLKDMALVIKGNFDDLPLQWKAPGEQALYDASKRDEPDRFPHVWLGEPDDEGGTRKVLPYSLLEPCVEMWDAGKDLPGTLQAGFDIADTGADRNALVFRRGPCIVGYERWSGTGSDLGVTARRAHGLMLDNNAVSMYYDSGGGYGGAIRAELNRIFTGLSPRPYARRGVGFGDAVAGPEREYTRGVSNADRFARRNSQLAWAFRMRALRTVRLKEGGDVNPERCLFINPELPRLEEFLVQLGQPSWDENTSGRIVVDKDPDDYESPDMYDAAVLAFTRDSRDGLRAV